MPNLPASGDEHRSLIALLIVSAFIVAGGIHYQTPMLAAIAAEFQADAATTGWIPTLSFGGMLVGILFFAPLGDRIDKRRLVLCKIVVLTLAQALMAAAPSIAVLAAGSLVTGICASLMQSFIAITAEIAHPNHRGRAMGTQLMAMFSGILFARIVGGLIATHIGWRYSYMLSAGMLLLIVPVLWARLPSTQPTSQASYRDLMWSIYQLLRTQGGIRRAAAIQFMFGICYGGFWAVAAPMLAVLHSVGPAGAGFMGIPGAAGIFVARPAGRWTDRSGVMPVVLTGIGSMLAAWVAMGAGVWSIAAVVIGAMLLDCGLRTAMVANQTLVNSAVPDSRARANTLFGMHVWSGNAVGAFLASWTFAHFGWLAVCGVAMTAIIIALLIHLGVLPVGKTGFMFRTKSHSVRVGSIMADRIQATTLQRTEEEMPDLPKWEISHIGIFVTDMDNMREFYTGILGFKVMDAGEIGTGRRLTFLSKDPKDHHQIVLVSGREKGTPSTINQITFRVASIKDVRAMHDLLVANKADGIDPVDHGNAWSVYFLDPEGNRLEFFCDTPWYVAQPRRTRLDFSLSDKEIEEATYRSIADDPTTRPFAEWRDEKRREFSLAK